jgi:hypothetical protein
MNGPFFLRAAGAYRLGASAGMHIIEEALK